MYVDLYAFPFFIQSSGFLSPGKVNVPLRDVFLFSVFIPIPGLDWGDDSRGMQDLNV